MVVILSSGSLAADVACSPITLACFAHAGGGAGRFRQWSGALGARASVTPIVLPGREGRFREPPLTCVHAMADRVLAEQPHLAEAPIALAGISFGALLAFEIGCRLQERGVPPVALFLASQRAVDAPSIVRAWHKLSDPLLVAKMVEIGGLDEELARDSELIEIFLGVIRADLQASETYASPARPRLACPLFIYRGVSDPAVSDEDMEAWRSETTGRVSIRRLDSGHFLTESGDDLWLAALREDFSSLSESSRWEEAGRD